MTLPKGFEDSTRPTHVCKFHKVLYGLKQAPRVQFERLKSTLLEWGFINSVSDNSLFVSRRENKLLLLLVYVGDILITGEDSSQMGSLVSDLNKKTNMASAKPATTPMVLGNTLALHDSALFEQPMLYRSTVGALKYLTTLRPDISFTVNKHSQFLHAPTVNHWIACKRLLRYIKGTPSIGLSFKPASRLQLEDTMTLIGRAIQMTESLQRVTIFFLGQI